MPEKPAYAYDDIPIGYYDTILHTGSPIRRLWHLSKFERVIDSFRPGQNGSILDIGCCAGSFLSLVPEGRFAKQVGVDIVAKNIPYATEHYGTHFRKFIHIESVNQLANFTEQFDCVTLIEVIEHLRPDEICGVLEQAAALLKPGGRLLMTTPNYASTWPVLERILEATSDVTYEEQHITRFTHFNFESRLQEIYPPFAKLFNVEFKCTTHFISPFLAGISFRLARGLSRFVPHRRWHHPFGNLVLISLERTEFVVASTGKTPAPKAPNGAAAKSRPRSSSAGTLAN